MCARVCGMDVISISCLVWSSIQKSIINISTEFALLFTRKKRVSNNLSLLLFVISDWREKYWSGILFGCGWSHAASMLSCRAVPCPPTHSIHWRTKWISICRSNVCDWSSTASNQMRMITFLHRLCCALANWNCTFKSSINEKRAPNMSIRTVWSKPIKRNDVAKSIHILTIQHKS